jgi:hypothetical protein
VSAFRIDAPGYTLRRLCPETWEVTSPAGAVYHVHPEVGTCTCPAGMKNRRRVCKHLRGLWALLRLAPDLERMGANEN